MSSKRNTVAAQQTSRGLPELRTTLPANCLLCRVLWPAIVGHRHLHLNESSNDSSEAKTLFRTKIRTANGVCGG